MRLDLFDQRVFKLRHVGGDTKTAIGMMTAGTSGNLRQFGRAQFAVAASIKFARLGKSDMVNIHV